jgi:hypothetical protein
MQANEHWESDEEFLARLAKLRAQRKAEKAAAEEAAKPKLVLPVSPETAERARADLRVCGSARFGRTRSLWSSGPA